MADKPRDQPAAPPSRSAPFDWTTAPGPVPLVGTVVSMAACLYCMLVGGRAVGLVYQARREQLGWFQ